MGIEILVNNKDKKMLDPKNREKFEHYLSLFEIKEFMAFMNIMGVQLIDKEKTTLPTTEDSSEKPSIALRRDFDRLIEEAYSKFCSFSRKERREIFKQMKIIYNCRLAALHGEKGKDNSMDAGVKVEETPKQGETN